MKLTDEQKDKMMIYGIPEHMRGGIVRFYENGIRPGHFLTAVIDNDLRGAVERADDINVNCLKAYVMWFYNCAPGGSWGYEGAADVWCGNFEGETDE